MSERVVFDTNVKSLGCFGMASPISGCMQNLGERAPIE
jgi:hypothetical protein